MYVPLHANRFFSSSPHPQHTFAMTSETEGMSTPSSVLIQYLQKYHHLVKERGSQAGAVT